MALLAFNAEVTLYETRGLYCGFDASSRRADGSRVLPAQSMDANYACIAGASLLMLCAQLVH